MAPICPCPCSINHEGIKVPRSSLQNTMKYGEGTEDVWVFTPEFLANQTAPYKAGAIHAMDDTVVAGRAAERIWAKNRVYGKGEFSWKVADALGAANEAAEKACAAKAEMNMVMKSGNNYIVEIAAFNRCAAYASQMFEEYVYLERLDELD